MLDTATSTSPKNGSTALEPFLLACEWIDATHPQIARQAQALSADARSQHELVRRCFEFVRDDIKHSVDHRLNPVTCRASDVLRYQTGYCFAKSHLLAALLRANGVATALCYQRVVINQPASVFSWHGLNAVYLESCGWYRLDTRGNKPGVNAQFTPPREQLAFALSVEGEYDYPGLYAEPLPEVIRLLTQFSDYAEVFEHLPDADPQQRPTLAMPFARERKLSHEGDHALKTSCPVITGVDSAKL